MDEYKVRLLGSDGQEYTITYEGLKQKLGVCAVDKRMDYAIELVRDTEKTVLDTLLIPEMEQRILHLLRENPNMKTHDVNAESPVKRLLMFAWYEAFEKLKKEKRIIGTSHGKGKNRTWRVKE